MRFSKTAPKEEVTKRVRWRRREPVEETSRRASTIRSGAIQQASSAWAGLRERAGRVARRSRQEAQRRRRRRAGVIAGVIATLGGLVALVIGRRRSDAAVEDPSQQLQADGPPVDASPTQESNGHRSEQEAPAPS